MTVLSLSLHCDQENHSLCSGQRSTDGISTWQCECKCHKPNALDPSDPDSNVWQRFWVDGDTDPQCPEHYLPIVDEAMGGVWGYIQKDVAQSVVHTLNNNWNRR